MKSPGVTDRTPRQHTQENNMKEGKKTENEHEECLERALSQLAIVQESFREKNARLEELEAEIRVLRNLLNKTRRIPSVLASSGA
jgi:hypothetical protein